MASDLSIKVRAVLEADKANINSQVAEMEKIVREQGGLKVSVEADTSGLSEVKDQITKIRTIYKGLIADEDEAIHKTEIHNLGYGKEKVILSEIDGETKQLAEKQIIINDNREKGRKMLEAEATSQQKLTVDTALMLEKLETYRLKNQEILKATGNEGLNSRLQDIATEVASKPDAEKLTELTNKFKLLSEEAKQYQETLDRSNASLKKAEEEAAAQKELIADTVLMLERLETYQLKNKGILEASGNEGLNSRFQDIMTGVKNNPDAEQLTELTNKYNLLNEAVKRYKEDAASAKKETELGGAVQKLQMDLDVFMKRYTAYKGNPELVKQVEEVQAAINGINTKADLNKARLAMRQLNTDTIVAGKNMKSFGDMISNAFDKFGLWMIAGTMFMQVARAISDGVRAVIELDTAMTDLQMVTGWSNAQARESVILYNQYAKALGVTTQAVMEGADEWLRQGKSIEETNQLIQTSTMFSRVAQIDNAESTKLLTAALNGYNLAASDAMSVVDKFNAVDLVAATSAKEIATSFQYVAASAGQAGISIDKLTGLLAVGSERTRLSAETIGQTWRTLIARMENVKVGNFVDDGSGDMTALNDVEKVLSRVGIALRDSSGAWRDLGDVIDDVGNRWKSFNTTQQNAISTAMAGVRQSNIFRATMANYGDVLKYTEVAQTSAGTTLDKFGVIMDSVGYKANKLSQSVVGMWENTINTSAIKGLLDALTWVVNGFHDLNVVILITLGLLAISKWDKITAIFAPFNELYKAIAGIPTVVNSATETIYTYKTALEAVGGAAAIAKVAILGLGLVFVGAIMAYNNYIAAKHEANKKDIEAGQAASDQADKLRDLYAQYENLAGISNRTTEQETQFKDIQNQIIPLLGDRKKALEGLTGGTKEYAEALKTVTDQENLDYLAQLQKSLAAARDEVAMLGNVGLFGMQSRVMDIGSMGQLFGDSRLTDQIKQIMSPYNLAQHNPGTIYAPTLYADPKNDPDATLKYYGALRESMDLVKKKQDELNGSGKNAEALTLAQSKEYKALNGAITDIQPTMDTYIKNQTEYQEALYQQQHGIPKTTQELDNMKTAVVAAIGANESLNDTIKKTVDDSFPALAKAAEDASNASPWEIYMDAFGQVADKVNVLKDAMEQQARTGQVEAATFKDIQQSGTDFANLLTATDGKLQINVDNTNKLINSLVEQAVKQGVVNGFTKEQLALIADLSIKTVDLNNQLAVMESSYTTVASAIKEYNDNGAISVGTFQALMALSPEYLSALNLENGQLIVNTQKLTDLTEAMKIDAIVKLRNAAASDIYTIAHKGLQDASNFAKIAVANMGDAIKGAGEKAAGSVSSLEAATDAMVGLRASAGEQDVSENVQKQIDAVVAAYSHVIGQISKLTIDFSNLTTGGNSSKVSSGGAKAVTQEVQEYVAVIDTLYKAEKRLSDLQAEISRTNQNDQITKYSADRIADQRKLIDLYKQEQDALHNLNEERRKQISANVDKLQGAGFRVDYDAQANDLYIANQEHINELTGKTQQETNDLRKAYEDLIKATEDLNKSNQQNSSTWFDVAKSMADATDSVYSLQLQASKDAISMMTITGSDKRDIVAAWKDVINGIHDQISQLKDKTSDTYRTMENDLNDAAKAMQDVLDSIVSDANTALSSVQNVYSTLTDAAQQFSDSGFITVDTFQKIAGLGVQYLSYLTDENGQLEINAETIKKVTAARTDDLAVQTALNYVEALRAAVLGNENDALNNLIFGTDAVSKSTWGLVYANLAQVQALGLSNDQYEQALTNINNLRSMADEAITGIGQATGQLADAAKTASQTLSDSLKQQQTGLDDLLKYVEDMIKQEVQNQIDALKSQEDAYQNIINAQKDSLKLAQQKASYDKTVADSVKSQADLQSQIALLSLDDSKEAQAQKQKLQEQLAKSQNDLQDQQNQYATDSMNSTLDDMAAAFKSEKDGEIKVLQNSVSSQEKIYELAVDRISNRWSTLYDDLKNWNYQYGNITQSTLDSAWSSASQAVATYGNYLNAVLQTQQQLAILSASTSAGFSNMSASTQTTPGGTAQTTPNIVGNTGSYDTGASSGAVTSRVKSLVNQMKANSAAWNNADAAKQNQLAAENVSLASQVASLLGVPIVKDGHTGIWYINRIGGDELYQKYHAGGIVGGSGASAQDDEVFALLQKGEAVLTKRQKETAYGFIDIGAKALEIFNKILGTSQLTSADAMYNKISSLSGGSNTKVSPVNNAPVVVSIGSIEAPVQVTKQLTDQDITDHADRIAQIAGDKITQGFSRRGITTLAGATLRMA